MSYLTIVVPALIIVSALVVVIIVMLLGTLVNTIGRLQDTNKQLMLIVAGKEEKPEHALRALVASNKPPQGKLKGIATGKKKVEKKPENVNYELTIGEPNAV